MNSAVFGILAVLFVDKTKSFKIPYKTIILKLTKVKFYKNGCIYFITQNVHILQIKWDSCLIKIYIYKNCCKYNKRPLVTTIHRGKNMQTKAEYMFLTTKSQEKWLQRATIQSMTSSINPSP